MSGQSGTAQGVNPWLAAARTITDTPTKPEPVPVQVPTDEGRASESTPVFVGAHGGAGVTAWASVLGGVDGGRLRDWSGEDSLLVLVARASLDGVDAAKLAVATHGSSRFACVLMVAAGPGKTPHLVASELKVLSGGVDLVLVRWEPGLLVRRASMAGATDIPSKELTKIIAALTGAGITFKGETA